jgi:hypothetical protein
LAGEVRYRPFAGFFCPIARWLPLAFSDALVFARPDA